MLTQRVVTDIQSSSEVVSNWFRNGIITHYIDIHPQDHLELSLLNHDLPQKGSILKLREHIGGHFYLSTKIKITYADKNEFKFKCLFPYSLLNIRASFKVTQKNKK